MVPLPEPTEFLYDLRAVAENISRERCVQWNVHPPKAAQRDVDVHVREVEVTNVSNSEAVCNPQVVEVTPPLVEPECRVHFTKSPSTDPAVNVAPAWHIPMTQERSLQELPSQLDLDWPDSVTPTPPPSLAATRNLGKELEAVGSSQVVDTAVALPVDAFVEVSQIAQEAATDASGSCTERVEDLLHAM